MPFALSKTLDERVGQIDNRIRTIEIDFGKHESMCKQRREETQRRFDNLEKGQAGLKEQLRDESRERKRDRQWAVRIALTVIALLVSIFAMVWNRL